MKVRYIREKKLNYAGKQYLKGAVLELEDFSAFPQKWFEIIKEPEKKVIEKIEQIERIEKKDIVDKKKKLYNNIVKNKGD